MVHDPFSHHSTDTNPIGLTGPYTVSAIPAGVKHGYVSNSGGGDSGSAMQTDMI